MLQSIRVPLISNVSTQAEVEASLKCCPDTQVEEPAVTLLCCSFISSYKWLWLVHYAEKRCHLAAAIRTFLTVTEQKSDFIGGGIWPSFIFLRSGPV